LNSEIANADDIAYVVVFSDEGDPLVAIEQVGQNHVQITKANDKTFGTILARLGVNRARTPA
ncbi:MAG: hypothetical protein ACYS0D_13525, partial [Planctomycetota bacterium]